MSRPIFKGILAIAALVLSASAFAQSALGPRPFPPPSYGPPTSFPIQGYEFSTFSGHGFIFTLDFDLAEVQKHVPAGYIVLPSPTDPTRASATAILALENFLTLTVPVGSFAPGTYGPYESLGIVVVTLAPSGFIEIVSLAPLVNNSEIADIQNTLQGAGSSRLADINVTMKETFGQLQIKAKVEDFDFGLRLNLSLTGPAEVTSQRRVEQPVPARAVNTLVSPPTPNARTSVIAKNDIGGITDPAALVVTGRLRLAGGKLPIVAARPSGFYWNSESFAKLF
jgi:hypothetical protein